MAISVLWWIFVPCNIKKKTKTEVLHVSYLTTIKVKIGQFLIARHCVLFMISSTTMSIPEQVYVVDKIILKDHPVFPWNNSQ